VVVRRSQVERALPWLRARQGALCTVGILVFCVSSVAQPTASDYQVEAAYLYNFAKLAEWSRQGLPEGAPLLIGVVGGDDSFVEVLAKTADGKRVGSHSVVVRHLSSTGDLKCCQMLFFRSSERKRTQDAIGRLGPSRILLVGEDKTLLRQGGIINLLFEKGMIRFEVDADALERANIRLSPQVLAQAEIAPGSIHAAAQIDHHSGDSWAGVSRKVALRISPDFPQLAERINLRGTVQVQAVVSRDGTVKKVTLIGGHPLLAEAALRAVLKWRYEPGPQETIELVKVSFGDTGTN
jgi:TonB family protein